MFIIEDEFHAELQQGEFHSYEEAHKEFSIGLLMLAFDYNTSNKEIALRISEFAENIGEKETANTYKELGEQ